MHVIAEDSTSILLPSGRSLEIVAQVHWNAHGLSQGTAYMIYHPPHVGNLVFGISDDAVKAKPMNSHPVERESPDSGACAASIEDLAAAT
eukprot:3006531-Amphidinium_carterae.2